MSPQVEEMQMRALYPVSNMSGVCGQGSRIGYCAMMHQKDTRFLEKANPSFRAIKNSNNPDVSIDKYREIEKQFAARGEPLNVESLVGMMSQLASEPNAKCKFDSLSKKAGSGYGLICTNPDGKKSEYAGLTEKLLDEKFAKNSENPPAEEKETLVAEDKSEETNLPAERVDPVVPQDQITIASEEPTVKPNTGLPENYVSKGIR